MIFIVKRKKCLLLILIYILFTPIIRKRLKQMDRLNYKLYPLKRSQSSGITPPRGTTWAIVTYYRQVSHILHTTARGVPHNQRSGEAGALNDPLHTLPCWIVRYLVSRSHSFGRGGWAPSKKLYSSFGRALRPSTRHPGPIKKKEIINNY